MNKFEETKKELKEDIKKLEKEVAKIVDGIDSLKSGKYWELKVLDLKAEIEQYKTKIKIK